MESVGSCGCILSSPYWCVCVCMYMCVCVCLWYTTQSRSVYLFFFLVAKYGNVFCILGSKKKHNSCQILMELEFSRQIFER